MANMVNTNYSLENRVEHFIDGQHRSESNKYGPQLNSSGRLQWDHVPSSEYTIFFTKNYEMFTFLPENRPINRTNKKNLMKSMMLNGNLFSAIFINEKGEIIDGQHRVKIKIELELHLPIDQRTGIYYIICKGYGIKEVQTYNDAQKRWDGNDFLHSYCHQGNENYIKFKEFMVKYDTDYWITLRMLTGNLQKKKNGVKSSEMNADFRGGKFVFNLEHYINGSNLMEKVEEIKNNNWFLGKIDRTFIIALDKVVNIENFDYKRFAKKLSTTRAQITEQGKLDLYIQQFGKIYNEGLPKDEQIKLPIRNSKNVAPKSSNNNKKKRINRQPKKTTL